MNRERWRDWWRERRIDAPMLALIVLFFGFFFARVVANHRFIIRADSLFYTYPLRTVAWGMLRNGQLPLWTPLLLSGYPLSSVSLLALAYPLTWGYLFLPGHWAEQVYAMAPFLLSPLTTYAYAREIGRSRTAALLAGLSFGYGGMMCGILAYSGMLTNSLMWTPLILLFTDRARTRPFARCLLGATAAFSMAVLAGHAQSYVYAGVLAIVYAGFLSVHSVFKGSSGSRRRWFEWADWRPLAVAGGACVLGTGIAAFQLFETFTAARLSVRNTLTYDVFSEGSFTLREALLSLGAQVYHYVDSATYVPPLALVLAATAIVSAFLRARTIDPRVWFWTVIGVVAFVLLLGANTPLNRVAYQLPIINKFRVPSRHTFEWTFAISILAAYGWDVWTGYFARRRERRRGNEHMKDKLRRRSSELVALTLLATTAAVSFLWWHAIVQWREPNQRILTALPEHSYWIWKLAFTVLLLTLTWCGFGLVAAPRLRKFVLLATVVMACFVEAHATAACWWAGFRSLPEARFEAVSGATRFLQQFPATENRVYTRVAMFSEEFNAPPRLESANLTMMYGLQNVAGMEPLISERYSRALGGVGPDSVMPRAGRLPNDDLFSARSNVLDLLNTTHLVTYAGTLQTLEDPVVRRDAVAVSKLDLTLTLLPGESTQLTGTAAPADQLALVTSLSNSVTVPQGSVVGRVRLYTMDGHMIDVELRAGIDTAEWAHERPDVRATVSHGLATIFDSRPADPASDFSALRYWTRLPLNSAAVAIRRVEISNVSRGASLSIWKASLANTARQTSTLLTRETRSDAWTPVYEDDRVQILRNARAMPRAWLVAEAEAVDGEEALHRIRGETTEFDPRRTALLEVMPDDLPKLPGGTVPSDSSARIVSYEPNRLVIETSAPTPSVLVLSEIFYPGWEATSDGQPARIMLTDYLLRGVALAPGRHRIEMHYTAPSARTGAIFSACTLLLLSGLAVYALRKKD